MERQPLYALSAAGLALAAATGWYYLSPASSSRAGQEQSANTLRVENLALRPATIEETSFSRGLENLSPESLAQFETQMKELAAIEIIASEDMPGIPSTRIATHDGSFTAYAEPASGRGYVLQTETGRSLYLDGFETPNGPNLHLYLAKDLTGREYYDLGALRATKGNVGYPLDAEINVDEYPYVLIWSVPFRVLFGSALLSATEK
ncbi:DM13 domain-containing protein [Candidatus Uhrbacteria bacterium]|nr:DM13 domain-containing protein [Candidatus Uhrbacteria bacterium]